MSNLPAKLSDLASALTESANSASGGHDGVYMSFKKGEWMYGAEEQEVDLTGRWVVNPEGFMHGWIGWGDKNHGTDGEKLGEQLTSASIPLTVEADLPEIQGSWSKQMAMQLYCLDGADAEVKAQFSSSSVGGMKFYAALVRAVVNKITANDEKCCPVIMLGCESYKHKTYGKQYNPTADIVDFMSVDDLAASFESGAPTDVDAEAVAEVKTKAKPKAVAQQPEVIEGEAVEVEASPEAEVERPPRRRRRNRAAAE
jgi:hypothetical protein